MDVAFLLKQYFPEKENVSIDVFDSHSLNDVYQQVLQTRECKCRSSWRQDCCRYPQAHRGTDRAFDSLKTESLVLKYWKLGLQKKANL